MRRRFPDGKGGQFSLRRGKEIAQSCHASLAFIARRLQTGETLTLDSFDAATKEWLSAGYAKVCVRVDSEEELMQIFEKAKVAGLKAHLVTDSGRTEFGGIPTRTCLAIGPDEVSRIDEITGRLQLY